MPIQRFATTCALLCVLASAWPADVRLPLDDRTLAVEANGTLAVLQDDRRSLTIDVGYFAPGWRKRDQADAIDVSTVRRDQGWMISGRIPTEGEEMRFEQTVEAVESGITIRYRLNADDGVRFQEGQAPQVSLWMPRDLVAGETLSLAGDEHALPVHNVHGWGTDLLLPPSVAGSLRCHQPVSQSLWTNDGKGSVEWRCKLPAVGDRSWELTVTLHPGPPPAAAPREEKAEREDDAPSERILAKLENYQRVLRYPSAPGVDAGSMLALIDHLRQPADGEAGDVSIGEVEDWLEAHARCHGLSGDAAQLRASARILDRAEPTAVDTALDRAVRALNERRLDDFALEATAVEAAIAASVEQHGLVLPGAAINPIGWIKAPTIQRLRHAPTPWRVRWKDGAELALCADPAPWDGTAADFEAASTWVTTRFLGEQTITFSALTPLIGIAGGDRIRLRGLSVERLRLPVDDALQAVALDGTVPEMTENWAIIEADGLRLLLVVTSPLIAVEPVAEGLDLVCAEAPAARLLRLDGVPEERLVEECRRWSRIALAMPVSAVEEAGDEGVTYRYGYERLVDAWSTEPLVIAPVPSLGVLAGLVPTEAEQSLVTNIHGPIAYLPGERVTVPALHGALPMLRGINVRMNVDSEALARLHDRGADWVRLVVGRGWPDEASGLAAVREKLELCREVGIQVLLDPHDFIFHVPKWVDAMPEDERAVADFTRLWDELSRIGADFPDTVVGYDLYNELKVRGDWAGWERMAQRAVEHIRANDPTTRIYMTGLVMANPEGFAAARPLPQEDVDYTFHFYRPHSFTHQKIQARSTQAPYTFYPGWLPTMDWSAGTHYGAGPMHYWDRWALGAAMLPVLEFVAQHRVRMHCGEFSVIGYSRSKAQGSAARWTADTILWFERQQYAWHLWNQGFGLVVPDVVPVVEAGWARSPR